MIQPGVISGVKSTPAQGFADWHSKKRQGFDGCPQTIPCLHTAEFFGLKQGFQRPRCKKRCKTAEKGD